LSNSKTSITGGLGLPKLREGDFCLVDRAPLDQKEMVREGCLTAEVWRISEVLDMQGDGVRRDYWPAGSMERVVSKTWVKAVVKMAEGVLGEGLVLGRWFEDAMHSWQVVSWAGNDRLQLGRVRSGVRTEGQGTVEVQVLAREGERGSKRVRAHLQGRGHDMSPVRRVVWRYEQCEASRTVEMAVGDLWPVTWVRSEGTARMQSENEGVIWYMLDQVPSGLMHQLYEQQETEQAYRQSGQVADADMR
jgi:hypothetical protein